MLGWNACLSNGNLKVSEVCRDKNDSRVGPEKHRWVTVQFQIRASQQEWSTLCTVIDEIGRAEQNLHQRESTTRTNDVPEWLCGGAMHVTCFLAQHMRASRFYLFGLRHACQWLPFLGIWEQCSGLWRRMCLEYVVST